MTDGRTAGDLVLTVATIFTEFARSVDDSGARRDVAEFIGQATAAAAANVGGPEVLLAGRPGSWEADCIRQLLFGTMGYEVKTWHQHRAEPVSVTLNVAELIGSPDLHPGLLGLDEAIDCGAADIAASGKKDGLPEQAVDQLVASLEQRYASENAAYAAQFGLIVSAVALSMRLECVELITDEDPDSRWWETEATVNPDPWGDPIVDEIWQRAHDITPLPNIMIRPATAEQ